LHFLSVWFGIDSDFDGNALGLTLDRISAR